MRVAASIETEIDSPNSRSAPSRSTIAAGGAALAAILIAFAAFGLFGPTHETTAMQGSMAETAGIHTGQTAAKASATTVTGPPTSVLPATTSTIAAPSGAPANSVPPIANVVEHAGRRYGLGSPGDVVVVGDWDCDGDPTPAILQMTTGRVAVFNSWPKAGETLPPSFDGNSIDANSLMADHVGACDVLRAVGPYGSTIFTGESP